ncbi:Uncharacterised protein [Vibrio cholerae]|nr:Uncharacterised protein [Vibrio cholerae]
MSACLREIALVKRSCKVMILKGFRIYSSGLSSRIECTTYAEFSPVTNTNTASCLMSL